MSTALLQLLRLASPALPVGGYSYSQGLEWGIDCGAIANVDAAQRWIGDMLGHAQARFELPLLLAMHAAWTAADGVEAQRLNLQYLASRETRELRAETLQMGYSLRELLVALPDLPAEAQAAAAALAQPTYPALYALAAASWQIAPPEMALAYVWSWAENQIMVLMKAMPLGQVAGQKLLSQLLPRMRQTVSTACAAPRWSNFAPGLAIASSRHETQYSRLFRS